MSQFIDPSNSKNQCLTKSVVQDCTFFGGDDLVSKSHLEAMRLLMDFRGAHQRLKVDHGRTGAQLRSVELKARKNDELFDGMSDKLEAYEDAEVANLVDHNQNLKAQVAKSQKYGTHRVLRQYHQRIQRM